MIRCISANHNNLELDTLEKVSERARTIDDKVSKEVAGVQGVVQLSTCNRVEFYIDCNPEKCNNCRPGNCAASNYIVENILPESQEKSAVQLKDIQGISTEELTSAEPKNETINSNQSVLKNNIVTTLGGNDVAAHLFRVASGLESAVVGEDAISGQVARALELAREKNNTTRQLELLFQRANRVSKEVKNKTNQRSEERSLISVALQMAATRLDDWADSKVLVIGTGSMANITLKTLKSFGVENISVYSTSNRKIDLSNHTCVQQVSDNELKGNYLNYDVIITATRNKSQEYVLKTSDLMQEKSLGDKSDSVADKYLYEKSKNSTKIIIDLGMPKNVDPEISIVSGIDILDIHLIKIHAKLDEFDASTAAQDIIDDQVNVYNLKLNKLILSDEMSALRNFVYKIADEEIAKTSDRYATDNEAIAAINGIKHFTGVFLHELTRNISDITTMEEILEFKSIVKRIFKL